MKMHELMESTTVNAVEISSAKLAEFAKKCTILDAPAGEEFDDIPYVIITDLPPDLNLIHIQRLYRTSLSEKANRLLASEQYHYRFGNPQSSSYFVRNADQPDLISVVLYTWIEWIGLLMELVLHDAEDEDDFSE